MEQIENTFMSISILQNKTFIVEDYQRGFKWGELEIVLLLEDIIKHDTKKGPYCLQPIIVKPIGENTFEIIDGQQRLTSLYLIMQFLSVNNEIIKYNIEYKTRKLSQLFLKDKKNFADILDSTDWQEFITKNNEHNNVDIFHFYDVFRSIQKWFETKDKQSFLKKLNDTLYIIWYDVTKGSLIESKNNSAENIFMNFNANKIDLRSSELIKALFILDHEAKLTKEQKKHNAIELALEWDAIENKLQSNTFWYFICNDEKSNYLSTRIDFLFDLAVNKVKSNDRLEAYREYEKIINSENNKLVEWKKIKTLFYKLDEWYNDNEMYHYIGFLIASQLSDIHSILNESDKKDKTDFKNNLIDKIRSEFRRSKEDKLIYNIDILRYDEHKKECNNLLLLLNVHYYLKDASNNNFPFNLYQEHKWSIEHVNPRNPQEITDPDLFLEWINSIEAFFANENNVVDLELKVFRDTIAELKSLFEAGKNDFEVTIKQLHFKKAVNQISDMIKVHNITNLALLDNKTNSALSNNNYLSKREIILRFDKNGRNDKGEPVFIPICTRDLFTKTYSYFTKGNVGNFFTATDMHDYKVYISEELEKFLTKQSAIDGTE